MGDKKVLRMRYKCVEYLDVEVDDPDKCNMLDIYIELLQGAAKKELCLPEHPSLWYMHESKSHKFERDNQLLELFSLLPEKKIINIAIGSAETPCENLLLAKGLIDSKMSSCDTNFPSSHHTIPSIGYMGETHPTPAPLPSQIVPYEQKTTPQVQAQPQPRSEQQHPLCNHGTVAPALQPRSVSFSLQERRIPATSAKRKGVYVPKGKNDSSSSQPNFGSGNLSKTRGRVYKSELMEDVDDVDSEDDIYHPSKSSSDDDENMMDDLVDEDETLLPCIDDGYDPDKSKEWKEDKDAYFDRLYANGELYVDKEFGNIILRQWMLFFDKEHLSHVLRNYCIQEGFHIITLKSDLRRFTAACASVSCNWRIHASRLSDGYTWAIKSLGSTHTCTRLSSHNLMASTRWAAEKLLDDVKANPSIKGKAMNELLLKRYGIELKKTATYDTRSLALATLEGSHDTSYAKLPAYCEVLKSTNPGSKAHIAWKVAEEHPEKPIHFKNIFISLRPMIEGFRGCRGLIALDGCHLKGKFGGVLIAATAVDGNTEIFPLAYGVYENESKDTWSSFIYHLKDALKDDVRDNLTIISDRQKGIEPALDEIWPTVARRYCCRHLCANFKKLYPGVMMHNLFWRCCDSYSTFAYEKAIDKLQKRAGWDAVKWLHESGNIERWARHKFDPTLCSDENTSNVAESFNSTLGLDRCSPVLSLLEGIRRTHMVRYVGRQDASKQWPSTGITPKIAKKLEARLKESRNLQVLKASSTECEVLDNGSYLPVNLIDRTCACGVWQISGIPCRHAIRAIRHMRTEAPVEAYVSSWFSVQAYKMAYSIDFHPVPDEEQWPKFNFPNIEPPVMKRGVGRPSRNRRREEDEKQKGKRSNTMRCGKCKAFGHNAKTCKGGPTARELKEQSVRVEQRQTKRCKKKVQVASQQCPIEGDVMGSAPWIDGSQQD